MTSTELPPKGWLRLALLAMAIGLTNATVMKIVIWVGGA